jgi:lantibiotic biosynthesis protein
MEQITGKELERINTLLETGQAENDSLLGGNLGLALYYYQSYKTTEDIVYRDKGLALLEEVFANLNSGEPRLVGPAFSNGGAGLVYLVDFLVQEHLLEFDIATGFEDLDRYLFNSALASIDDDHIDCLHGAFGIIHVFSARPANSAANRYMDVLIEKICSKPVQTPHGLWFRSYVMQTDEKKEINFSLSHGLSGMLLILLEAYPVSAHKDLIRQTVKEGTRFILKHTMCIDFSSEEYSFFPFWIDAGAAEIENKARLGWCYGDLNETLLFYRAGKLLADDELIRIANLAGLSSLMRKDEASTRVADPYFCHGSAGLAQFYKVLYNESGNAAYLNGYAFWIEQTLLFLRNDNQPILANGKKFQLLDGLVGTALVLLDYTSEKPLNWSRMLFL